MLSSRPSHHICRRRQLAPTLCADAPRWPVHLWKLNDRIQAARTCGMHICATRRERSSGSTTCGCASSSVSCRPQGFQRVLEQRLPDPHRQRLSGSGKSTTVSKRLSRAGSRSAFRLVAPMTTLRLVRSKPSISRSSTPSSFRVASCMSPPLTARTTVHSVIVRDAHSMCQMLCKASIRHVRNSSSEQELSA